MNPSNSFPRNAVILDGTNAFADEVSFAVHNPTGSAIDATVIGAFITYDTDGYYEDATAQTIPVQPGATLYGRFTSVNGAAGLMCYF